MKTVKDLEEKRSIKEPSYGNQYNYYFESLAHAYISSIFGIDRIHSELQQWDDEAQLNIILELYNRIIATGIQDEDVLEKLSGCLNKKQNL